MNDDYVKIIVMISSIVMVYGGVFLKELSFGAGVIIGLAGVLGVAMAFFPGVGLVSQLMRSQPGGH